MARRAAGERHHPAVGSAPTRHASTVPDSPAASVDPGDRGALRDRRRPPSTSRCTTPARGAGTSAATLSTCTSASSWSAVHRLARRRRTTSTARPRPSALSLDSAREQRPRSSADHAADRLPRCGPGAAARRTRATWAYGIGTSGYGHPLRPAPAASPGSSVGDGRDDLAGQPERLVVLVDDDQPAGLGHRLEDRLAVERHQAAQVDHLDVDALARRASRRRRARGAPTATASRR